jgi:hypothetical protein
MPDLDAVNRGDLQDRSRLTGRPGIGQRAGAGKNDEQEGGPHRAIILSAS